MKKLEKYDESGFWKQLEKCKNYNKTAVDSLIANVGVVHEQAAFISGIILKYLPQYTLHNETHSLNVLSIMGELVPQEVMDKLTPLECALCIMAAYTHDLGMALTADEYNDISGENGDTPGRLAFLRYRDGFGEEIRQIERWKKKGGEEAKKRIELIEGHILASFIRMTHASMKNINRVETWLDEIIKEAENKSLFTYNGESFKRDLALICISHGEDVSWLRKQYPDDGRTPGFYRMYGNGEWVNLAFPGLLLRLADIMDFDASRAPGILFKHKLPREWRTAIIVKGMYVNDVKVCERELDLDHGVGCKVWVDLRGDASPRLTADRKNALEPDEPAGWRDAVHGMFKRMIEDLDCQIQSLPSVGHSVLKNLLSGFSWRQLPRLQAAGEASGFSLLAAGSPKWGKKEDINAVQWLTVRLMQDLTRDLDLARALARASAAFGDCLLSSFLQEGFWPDLSRSLPMFKCFHLQGKIGDAMIAGPGLVEFDLEKGGTVHLTDRDGNLPEEAVKYGYHLVFPMTAIPLGKLRRNCPEWRADRRYRPLGVLPFLYAGSEEAWAKYSDEMLKRFRVKQIFALMPRIQLWSKRFDCWTEEDWRTCGLSALWDIASGQVLWAEGAHHIEEMRRVGKPVREFLKGQ